MADRKRAGVHMARQTDSETWIVYDGQCPFCSRYVRLVRLRETIGQVQLIDARQGGPQVEEARRAGLDLDDGMVLKLDGRLYHGADCIHMLALLSTPSSRFNRLNAALFRSPTASRILYPVLRTGRNAVLRMLGRSKIDAKGTLQPGPDVSSCGGEETAAKR
jgi:predicted DCC family thiol-disulfide oxidoreductase YuxK